MRHGFYINNNFFHMNDSIIDFISLNFGLGLEVVNRFEERFEIFYFEPLTKVEDNKLKYIEIFFYQFIPFLAAYKSRVEVNILYLDLISSYRGWRHSKGLPVRGQRTWSNAWSSYRSNLLLREIKLKIAKKYYGNLPENEINMAYLAEDINSLWKVQWEHEWKAAKKKVKIAERANQKNPIKIDLSSMAQNNVVSEEVLNKKVKANKKKRVIQKNVFTLGFDPGFTKFVLRSKHKLTTANQINATILETSKQPKKTLNKKKVDIKAQKIAHKTKKKNKKSLWE